jgi:hypothetical protein
MARKSNLRIDGESALANLLCIAEMAADDRAVYTRNAGDCSRWCTALRNAGMAYPQFMFDGNIRYFASIWGLPHIV